MSDTFALAGEVLAICWINLLLSGDNAILIAVACAGLPERQRRLGILLGAAASAVEGSIALVVFGLLSSLMDRYPVIGWAGGELIAGDPLWARRGWAPPEEALGALGAILVFGAGFASRRSQQVMSP